MSISKNTNPVHDFSIERYAFTYNCFMLNCCKKSLVLESLETETFYKKSATRNLVTL